jgi:para-nitrobenzyl esterase
MSVRVFTTLLCLAVLSALAPSWFAAQAGAVAPEPTLVRVEGGWLRGERAGDTVRFQGVPYAAPPVGPSRFTAPRPPRPWEGVRDATAPGEACPQPGAGPEAPRVP